MISYSIVVLSFIFYFRTLLSSLLDHSNGDLVIAEALWEVELKRRKIKGLMAELETIVIPIIAWQHFIMNFLIILDLDPKLYSNCSQSHALYKINLTQKIGIYPKQSIFLLNCLQTPKHAFNQFKPTPTHTNPYHTIS